MKLALRITAALGLAALAGLTALGATARWTWSGEVVANAAWHVGLAGVGVAALLLLSRWPRLAVAALALCLLNLWRPLALWLPGPDVAGDGARLRAVSVNVYEHNIEVQRFLEWLRQTDPDVVAVQEATLVWYHAIRELAEEYPHAVLAPERLDGDVEGIWGVALLSRHPLLDVVVHETGAPMAAIEATAIIDGVETHLVVMHTVAPHRPWRRTMRDQVLDRVAGVVEWTGADVVLGDLNATEGSPAFREFLAATGLRDSRRGFGRQPTWWSTRWVPGLDFPLDHVLVGGRVAVEARRVGEDVGSDHRPVVADLRVLPEAR